MTKRSICSVLIRCEIPLRDVHRGRLVPASPAERALPGGFQVGRAAASITGRAVEPGDDQARASGHRPSADLAEPAEGQAAEEVGHGASTSLGPDFQEEPRRRLGEQQDGVVRRVVVAAGRRGARRSAPRPPARAISARATARPPSLRSWQLRTRPRADRRVDRPEDRPAERRVDPRAPGPRRAPGPSAQCDPPSSSRVVPDEEQEVARLLQVHRHAPADVGHLAHRADQERRRDRQALALVGVLVVQAVLARDERRAVGQGQRRGSPCAAQDQRAERLGPLGVAPAEVVEEGDPVGVGPDGHAVADGLVDHAAGHRVGVELGRSAG